MNLQSPPKLSPQSGSGNINYEYKTYKTMGSIEKRTVFASLFLIEIGHERRALLYEIKERFRCLEC
ncbi:hypothetical protein CHH80_14725 [Bacillus sp. 7504-2]|nr:hypothetical protein CHH80_14725 [Bacillus sp. 7504-2]